MPIFRGSTEITDLQVGSTPINEVYVGSTLVWARSVANLVFDALTPDGSEIMQGVLTGAGSLSETRGGTLWVKDYQDIYREFAPNEAGWVGGRVTGAVGSRVVFANDGVNPLPQIPRVCRCRATTNLIPNNTALDGWTTIRTPDPVQNLTGIQGVANDAWSLTDNNNTNPEYAYNQISITSNTSNYNHLVWVRKQPSSPVYPVIGLHFGSTFTQFYGRLIVDEVAGTGNTEGNATSISFSIDDDSADWWKCVITVANNNLTLVAATLYPAYSLDGSTVDGSATGTSGFHCPMILGPLAGARARWSSPVFTTGTTASVDNSDLVFSFANHSDTQGAYYFEFQTQGTGNLLNLFSRLGGGALKQLTDSTNTINGPVMAAGTMHRIGIAYGQGSMDLNVNGTWYGPSVYDGSLAHDTTLDVMRAFVTVGEMRKLQRYDNTYLEARTIIDGLMA